MSEKKEFPCTICGCCCKRISKIVETIKLNGLEVQLNDPDHYLYFPYSWNDKGECEHLTKDNLCNIYHARPKMCNADKMKIYQHLEMPIIDYYKVLATSCNLMMDQDKIDPKYRINLNEII